MRDPKKGPTVEMKREEKRRLIRKRGSAGGTRNRKKNALRAHRWSLAKKLR